VLLSVQSNDLVTDSVMNALFKDGLTLEKYSKLTQEEIFQKIKRINFNKKKSEFIFNAIQKINKEFDGKVPNKKSDLLAFKGVGNKIANLVMEGAFG
jgi:endonuclease III